MDHTSSNWTVTEQQAFPDLLGHYGTDWHSIASSLKTKTDVMVKNYFNRQVVEKPELEQLAREVDERRVVDSSPAKTRTVIGKAPNHWVYDASRPLFDLTHPSAPGFEAPSPKDSISLTTTSTQVVISPALTALVIIDMQNFFLSTALGRPADGQGNKAKEHLLKKAIPAARKAGIRIIWLNWGLTDDELDCMPPSTRRAFGFEASLSHGEPVIDDHGINMAAAEAIKNSSTTPINDEELTENGKPKRIYRGLGSEIGPVELADGTKVDGGRLLMRDTWNASLPPALEAAYKEGLQSPSVPDVWIHKNRMSGLWGSGTACTEFLEEEGIRTLLFAGVNTDQCVGGSLQDAFTKGWDCILLSDGCGTTSPQYATDCVEYNCARTWGFVTDSQALEKGVEGMMKAKEGSH